jgi:ParB family chromosome partitioning protein
VSVNRLGKGLEALIRPEAEQKKKPAKKPTIAKPGVTEIPLKEIRPNPNQPRRDFDESALDELAASIKEKGILTPVTVREVEDGYELVAGERRWRASKKCRKRTIPAYLIAVKDDAEMMEMALIENIQREDLNSLDESEAYAVLNSKFEMSHEAIAKAVGKKRVTVSNSLRLLKLPPDIRKSLRKGDISAGHARAILQAKTGPAMNKIWKIILSKDLSVRGAEALVKAATEPPKKKKIILTKKSPQIQALENQLIEVFGTKVKLKPGKKGGAIEISYFSDDDLERILDLINSFSQ